MIPDRTDDIKIELQKSRRFLKFITYCNCFLICLLVVLLAIAAYLVYIRFIR